MAMIGQIEVGPVCLHHHDFFATQVTDGIDPLPVAPLDCDGVLDYVSDAKVQKTVTAFSVFDKRQYIAMYFLFPPTLPRTIPSLTPLAGDLPFRRCAPQGQWII